MNRRKRNRNRVLFIDPEAEIWDVHRELQAEKRLMVEVLKDAIECLGGKATGITSYHEPARQKLVQQTEEWFLSEDSDYVFSFCGICTTLGYDSDEVRRKVMSGRNEHEGTYVRPD